MTHKITIISAIYPPEPVVSAQTSASLAKFLAMKGYDVMVITAFPSRPAGKLYPGYKRRLLSRETGNENVNILRCYATLSPTSSLVNRFLENISFGITSGLTLLFSEKADLIYLNTWPLFATGIAALIARIKKIPYILSVQDLYPESLITQKRIAENGLIAQLMQWLDTWIAEGAQSLVVISPWFRKIYTEDRGISIEKIHIIPNWVDASDIKLDIDTTTFRQQLNIPDNGLLLTYAGNIGAGAGVEDIIRQFQKINHADIYLMIAGDGPNLLECQTLATGHPRIFFHTPWPVEETSLILGIADVCILPTKGTQSLVSVPSKLISYMLAAKPVIAIALPESETAHMIQAVKCGWVLHPDKVDELAELVIQIRSIEKSDLIEKGRLARNYALTHLTSGVCLPQVVKIIEKATASNQENLQ